MRFSVWQIRIPELRSWVGKQAFEDDTSELLAGRDCPTVQISYRTPHRQVLLSDAAGLDLSLAFWPLVRSVPDVPILRQNVYLELRQGLHLDTLDDYMRSASRFEYFLTLATGHLVHTGSIKAVVRTEGADVPDRLMIVDILYQPVRNVDRRSSRTVEHLFTLGDIAGREGECFRNWFAKADREKTRDPPEQYSNLVSGVGEVLARRGGAAPEVPYTSSPDEVRLRPHDLELVRDVFWDLFRLRSTTSAPPDRECRSTPVLLLWVSRETEDLKSDCRRRIRAVSLLMIQVEGNRGCISGRA